MTSKDTESEGGLNLATKEQSQIMQGHYQAQSNHRRRVLPERKQRNSRHERMRKKRKLPLQPAKDNCTSKFVKRSRAKLINTKQDEIGEAEKNNPANSSGNDFGSIRKPGPDTGKVRRFSESGA